MQYGLIGEKLGHSYSPLIHARLADYQYELREVAREDLGDLLTRRDFKGLNVTIPYKRDVIPYCAELSDTAQEVGSVNTIIVRPDGTLYGHNTDIGGFIHMLKSARIDPAGCKALILGSGGTCLTAKAALRRLGASSIHVVSRSGELNYDNLYDLHGDAEILVNASPAGMFPNNGVCRVDLDRLPKLKGVVDVVYNPERTALILNAQARGIPCVSGLPMLIAQAREAAELFLGKTISPEADKAILGEIQSQTLNLILVGMPGCGKSSLGAALAEAMDRPFVDCDDEIARRAGMSIPDIFAKYGEEYFRRLETKVLEDACKRSGTVIATGGGAVLRDANVRAMRQNGRICLILRNIDILPLDGRPLSSSTDAVRHLWEARRERYLAASDFTIDNNDSLSIVAGRIREGFYEAAHH